MGHGLVQFRLRPGKLCFQFCLLILALCNLPIQGLLLIVSAGKQPLYDFHLLPGPGDGLPECIEQHRKVLLLLLEPEHLILRFPELILRPGDLRLGLSRRLCRLLKLLSGSLQLLLHLCPALFQPVELICPGQYTGRA